MSCDASRVARKIYNIETARPAADELGRLSAIYMYSKRPKRIAVIRRRLPFTVAREDMQPVKIIHAG